MKRGLKHARRQVHFHFIKTLYLRELNTDKRLLYTAGVLREHGFLLDQP
jgi:hypothetical protein